MWVFPGRLKGPGMKTGVQGSGGKEENSGVLPRWLPCETQDGCAVRPKMAGIILLGTRSGS